MNSIKNELVNNQSTFVLDAKVSILTGICNDNVLLFSKLLDIISISGDGIILVIPYLPKQENLLFISAFSLSNHPYINAFVASTFFFRYGFFIVCSSSKSTSLPNSSSNEYLKSK